MRGAPLCDPGPLADTVPPFPCLYTESSPPRPGSRLTRQDLASFRPEVVDALAVPLGDYTLYSPPPPAGGAILSFVLNVLKGFNFTAESVAGLEGRVNLYHHLVETLKFAGGQRWRLWDPRSHPEVQVRCPGLVGSPVPAPGLRVRPVSALRRPRAPGR